MRLVPMLRIVLPTGALVLALAAVGPAAWADPSEAGGQPVGSTRLLSHRYDGSQTTGASYAPAISDDARYVAYQTEDPLVTGPGRAPCCQVVRYDAKTKTTDDVSATRKGAPAKGGGAEPDISADGNVVAFWSSSKRLVRGDTEDFPDVFVRNMTSGKTTLVSRTPAGKPGNGDSRIPSISADGTRIAFESDASDLASADTNQTTDIFLYDTTTKQTTLVSRGLDGKSARGQSLKAEISADGTHVVYFSSAENLVAGDANQAEDVFSYDVATSETQLISVAEDGTQGNAGSFNPSVSGDGLFVTFWSLASNFAASDDNGQGDVFVKTTDSPKITLVSRGADGHSGHGESDDPTISTTGRMIAFQSVADLDPFDTNGVDDIYRYDLGSGVLVLVTVASSGAPADDSSFLPSLSEVGDYVAYESIATDLVRGDTNGVSDVFVTRLA